MKAINLKLVLFMGLQAVALQAHALCLDGRRPSVSEEFHSSKAVAVGTVVAMRNISSPDDPEGIEETIYLFRPSMIFKGSIQKPVEIHSENTSSRFPMTVGSKYAVFLLSFSNEYMIDSCGNSALVKNRSTIISQLRRIAEKERRRNKH